MRSLLFVPGDSERKLEKALQSGADALIIDLEDSVSAANKQAARALTADPPSRSLPAAFAAVIALQYALGVLTLLWVVPVSIASAHQLVALALVAIWVAWMHHLRESTAASGT